MITVDGMTEDERKRIWIDDSGIGNDWLHPWGGVQSLNLRDWQSSRQWDDPKRHPQRNMQEIRSQQTVELAIV